MKDLSPKTAFPSALQTYQFLKKESLLPALQSRFKCQDNRVLVFILNVIQLLRNAAKESTVEADDLRGEARAWEGVLEALLRMNSLDDPRNLALLLVPYHRVTQRARQVALPRRTLEEQDKHESDFILNCAAISDKKFPLSICIEHGIHSPFGFSTVLGRVMMAFYGCYCYASDGHAVLVLGPAAHNHERQSHDRIHDSTHDRIHNWIHNLLELSWSPRSCPAVLFFLEGLSKAAALLLIFYVCVREYGHNGSLGYTGSVAQVWLLIYLCTSILYELGQLRDKNKNSILGKMRMYAFNPWNALDILTLTLLLLWAFLLRYPSQYVVGQILLSVSAIPQSVCLLEYLSVIPSVGRLVIMLVAMLEEHLVSFTLLFCFTSFGFAIALWGLFNHSGEAAFGTAGYTSTQLFAAALGGQNYLIFDHYPVVNGTGWYALEYKNHYLTYTGIVVYMAFSVIIGVLMINLLIARMTGTHDKIESESQRQWGFLMVRYN